MRNLFFTTCFFIGLCSLLNSQVRLALQKSDLITTNEKCFEVVLLNESSDEIALAGQNYRLYYDSHSGKFKDKNVVSYLSSAYTKINVVQSVFNADATGFGKLDFENRLGFINLATDFYNLTNEPIYLAPNKPQAVLKMCFESDKQSELVFLWAESSMTDGYATAFNEMSYLGDDNLLHPIVLNVEQTIQDKLPEAFVLGNMNGNPVLDNGIKVSLNDNAGSTSLKSTSFVADPAKGKYIILASPDTNSFISSMIKKNEIVVDDKSNVFMKYFSNMEEAMVHRIKWINVGLENAQVFKVNDFGSIEKIKEQ